MRLPARLSLALALLVAACAQPRPPQPQPAPTRAPPPPAPLPPPPARDWRDWPVTPGIWTYARDSRGTRAMFGRAGEDARIVLRCDAAERRLFLSVAGDGAAPITVRTSSAARTIAVQPTGGTLPYVAAALAPRDPLLDAMAFSRGRFAIERAGTAPMAVPAWAEIGRVIEDCRGG